MANSISQSVVACLLIATISWNAVGAAEVFSLRMYFTVVLIDSCKFVAVLSNHSNFIVDSFSADFSFHDESNKQIAVASAYWRYVDPGTSLDAEIKLPNSTCKETTNVRLRAVNSCKLSGQYYSDCIEHAAFTFADIRDSSSSSRRDSEKARILELQQFLAKSGFGPGPIDGLLGPQTRRAFEAFRDAHDLPAVTPMNATSLRALTEDGPKTEFEELLRSIEEEASMPSGAR